MATPSASSTRLAEAEPGRWLSVEEACRFYGVHRHTIYAWIDAGHLTARKFGPRLLRVWAEVPDQ